MNRLFFIPIACLFFSCNQGDARFVRKKVGNNEIVVRWYYHSNISNVSPDFVVVEKNGERKEIYKATRVVLNVTLKDHDIVLKLVEPSKNMVFTKKVEKEVYGYNIVLDTSGTYDELRLVPDGIKESN